MNIRIEKLLLAGFFLSLMVLGTGCTKFERIDNIQPGTYNPEFAIPLFQSKGNFRQIMEQFNDDFSSIIFEGDGKMRINYIGEVATIGKEYVLENLPPALIATAVDSITYFPLDLPDGISISKVKFSGGTINLLATSAIEDHFSVTIQVPQLTKDGIPFEETIGGLYLGSTPVAAFKFNIPLDGYEMTPENDSLLVNYSATVNGESVLLEQVVVTLSNYDYTYIEGFLGTQTEPIIGEEIEFDYFENWSNGDIFFEDPKINITVLNSFGFPIAAQINTFNIKYKDGHVETLESPALDDGIDFPYPGFDQIGETITSIFTFDQTNSNIREVISADLASLTYDMDAIANPDGDSTLVGFMTDSSSLTVQFEVDLPIYGTFENYLTQDTFEAEFDGYENVEEAEFKVVADNGIPMEAVVQFYFYDQENMLFDSLLPAPKRFIEGATVDGNGDVTGIATTTTFVEVLQPRFERLKQAAKVLMEVNYSSTNTGGETVRVLSEQAYDVRVGMKLKYRE